MSDDTEATDRLESILESRHPFWSVRYGRHSGLWIACPLWAGSELSGLCEGSTVEQLEQSMEFVERKYRP